MRCGLCGSDDDDNYTLIEASDRSLDILDLNGRYLCDKHAPYIMKVNERLEKFLEVANHFKLKAIPDPEGDCYVYGTAKGGADKKLDNIELIDEYFEALIQAHREIKELKKALISNQS